jgi:hypothetical protein
MFAMWFSLFLCAKLLLTIPSYVYKIKPSLEMSLLPYVEKYRGSTYFFCASQLTTGAVLVGSWWPGGIG